MYSSKERHHCEDMGVDKEIILKWITKNRMVVCVDWIHLAQGRQGRDQYRTLANMIMNLPVP
jgi:hypothetical protein